MFILLFSVCSCSCILRLPIRWQADRLTTGSMRTGTSICSNYDLEYLFYGSNLILMSLLCRVWNEENRDYEVRRAQLYMVQGFILGNYILGVKTLVTMLYNQMITRDRYVRDTYKELDISELPPGEVLQTSWNGDLIFVRRLTKSEVDQTYALPASTQLDKESKTSISDAGNSSVVCCSAICTHLGCIPVPYLGAYKGWVCLCHGSVYDKFGRVRQGPAVANLPWINNQVHGPVLCIEEMQYPNEPSIFMYV